MKKLRITVEGRPYEVLVEVLEDDGAQPHSPSAPPPAPVDNAPTQALATPQAHQAATRRPAAPARAGSSDVLSQISGMVVAVEVAVGDDVKEGQRLLTIESMKMNTYVVASSSGYVSELLVAKGTSVLAGDVLLRLG